MENRLNEEAAQKPAVGPYGQQRSRFPLLFAKAAFFGERPVKFDRISRVTNGTITFVDLGQGPFGITCSHVVAAYRNMREELDTVVFQIGNVELDPLEHLIDENPELDLATIRLSQDHLKTLTKDGEIGSCVFKPVTWPSPSVVPGDFIVFGGFPGHFRKRISHDEVVFTSWSSGGSLVTTSYEDRFSCRFDREYWISSPGEGPHMTLQDLGGMSGGPAFMERHLYFDFVGIAYEYSSEYDVLFFRPANLINSDGSIRR